VKEGLIGILVFGVVVDGWAVMLKEGQFGVSQKE